MSLRFLLLLFLLGVPAFADENPDVKFFGVGGSQESPAGQAGDSSPAATQPDFPSIEAAVRALPAQWWTGPTSGPEWDKLVADRLTGKSLGHTGNLDYRRTLSDPPATLEMSFGGELSPANGSVRYEILMDVRITSKDPVRSLPLDKVASIQGRIVSAQFVTKSGRPVLAVKLENAIVAPGSASGSPPGDGAALAADNARLKAEVARLTSLCQAYGINPREAPPDPNKPAFGSVEEALKAMPPQFFDRSANRDMRLAYLAHTMARKLVRVRGTVAVDPTASGRFQLSESAVVTVRLSYPPGQEIPRVGDKIDASARITQVLYTRTGESGPLQTAVVYVDVVGSLKP